MSAFEAELVRHRFTLDRILIENARKGQVTALVRDKRQRLLVAKWNESASPTASSGLANEERAYRELEGAPFLAQTVLSEPTLLVVEHVPSCTLRQLLLTHAHQDDAKVATVLEKLFAIFGDWYRFEQFYLARETYVTLMGSLKRLCVSGPHGTRATWNRWTNRMLVAGPVAWSKFAMSCVDLGHVAPVRIHGDLHLDNVLVANDSCDVKLIDWENSTMASPVLDFLYSTAMIGCLVAPHERTRGAFDTLMEKAFRTMPSSVAEMTRYLHDLFSIVVATNVRFRGKLTKREWIRTWQQAYELSLLLPTS